MLWNFLSVRDAHRHSKRTRRSDVTRFGRPGRVITGQFVVKMMPDSEELGQGVSDFWIAIRYFGAVCATDDDAFSICKERNSMRTGCATD